MKKLTLLLIVGLCLAVSGFAQQKLGSRARLKARPKPPVPAKAAAETPPAAGIKRGAKEAVADKMVAATREDPPPPPPTGNVSRFGAPNQNRPPRTTRSAQPKKKSGNDLLRPNKRNRSHTNAKGKKYFLNVDANGRLQRTVNVSTASILLKEPDALTRGEDVFTDGDSVDLIISEPQARGRGAERAQPNRRVRNARQQTRSTTPKRNATKRSNNITLPQTGAVNRRKSQPSTGLDDESDMTWEALDTIDTKLDELTTKIADTILKSADDPVLKRQSLIRQSRILEIKESLKVLKENLIDLAGGAY
jgi:hypothetical protein